MAAIMNEMMCPTRKSHRDTLNHLVAYSRAFAGSSDILIRKSSLLLSNGSNALIAPFFSRISLTLPIPTRFACPHSEACSDTSIPVGNRPRNAAMSNHEPSGISTRKKCPNADSGAGRKKKTLTADTTSRPAKTLVRISNMAYFPSRMMLQAITHSSKAHPHKGTGIPTDIVKR